MSTYVRCCVCEETCYHSYFYAEGDYYCQFCHSHTFSSSEWEDLHNESPDEYYWSSYNDDDYESLMESEIADRKREDILVYGE